MGLGVGDGASGNKNRDSRVTVRDECESLFIRCTLYIRARVYVRGVYMAVRYNCVFVFFKKKQTDSWGDGVIIQTYATRARSRHAESPLRLPKTEWTFISSCKFA